LLAKLRMQRQIHQAALTRWLDFADCRHRLRTQLAVLNDAHAAHALGEEDAPIRSKGDGPGHCQILGHCFDTKLQALTIALRACHFARAATARWRATTCAQ
jgi:hypothetical protein